MNQPILLLLPVLLQLEHLVLAVNKCIGNLNGCSGCICSLGLTGCATKDILSTNCTAIQGTFSTTTNSCFKIYHSEKMAWHQADNKCVNNPPAGMKGRLAVVPSQAVLDLLQASLNSQSSQGAWFGLRARDNSKHTTGKTTNGCFPYKHEWAFFEGKKVVGNFDWDPPQVALDDFSISSPCIRLKSGGSKGDWGDIPCFAQLPAVCEYFIKGHEPTVGTLPVPRATPCPSQSSNTNTNVPTTLSDSSVKQCDGTISLTGCTGCICSEGYTACPFTDIDNCTPNPCLNGATCKDKLTAFQCTCIPGYTGSRCETNINDCVPNPCGNGGVCQDLVNGFKCTCPQGYTGERCQTNINECSPSPCMNGGVCQDLVNGFRCTCPAGFTGTTCQTRTTCTFNSGMNNAVAFSGTNPCKNADCSRAGVGTCSCTIASGSTATLSDTHCSLGPQYAVTDSGTQKCGVFSTSGNPVLSCNNGVLSISNLQNTPTNFGSPVDIRCPVFNTVTVSLTCP